MTNVTLSTPLVVSEIDSITGSRNWDETETIVDLRKSGWYIDQSDINELNAIGETKILASNGRRVIFLKVQA